MKKNNWLRRVLIVAGSTAAVVVALTVLYFPYATDVPLSSSAR